MRTGRPRRPPQIGGMAKPARSSAARRDDQPGGMARPARPRRDDQPGGMARPARPRRDDQPGRTPRPGRAVPLQRKTSTSITNKWGSVARRGARALGQAPGDGPSASEVWRETVARAGGADASAEPWLPDETWIADPLPVDEPAPRPHQDRPVAKGPQPRDLAGKDGVASPGGRRRNVPRPVVDELAAAAAPGRGGKLAARIADATYAYERERYQDAQRILRSIADEVPGSAAARELYGLVLYRTGQWSRAVAQLEAYRQLSGSFDQHPVLADCYRALHRYGNAEAIWEELKGASPSGDLVAEGRIVAAGCRADQGDLAGAIAVLDRAGRRVSHPQGRHLRQWYALADLHERAGDLPRARELFLRVAAVDPDAFDVRQRVRALR